MSGYFSQLASQGVNSSSRVRPRVPMRGESEPLRELTVESDPVTTTTPVENRMTLGLAGEEVATTHLADSPTKLNVFDSEPRKKFDSVSNSEERPHPGQRKERATSPGELVATKGAEVHTESLSQVSQAGDHVHASEPELESVDPGALPTQPTRQKESQVGRVLIEASLRESLLINFSTAPRELVDRAQESAMGAAIVKVTIGRLEVGAAPQAKPSEKNPTRNPVRAKRLELEEFLDQRRKARR